MTHAEQAAETTRQVRLRADGDCVLMCSGQGAQRPGMGRDLLDVPAVREALTCASDVFGFDIARTCAEAGQEELNDTRVAQAALCSLSLGIARALEARGIVPQAVIGFSLGQIPALAIAGMLSDEEALRLAAVRSRAMGAAADAHPGAMTALLKSDPESAQRLCDQRSAGEVLVIANYNCPGQIVVGGTVAAIERAERAWSGQGKRCRRLATSGAFHTPLMADARDELAAYLETVTFAEARVPLVCNTDACELTAARARQQLANQLTSPVRFQQGIEALAAAGAQTYLEAGVGGVLAGFVRRIAPQAASACAQDAQSFEEALSCAGREGARS